MQKQQQISFFPEPEQSTPKRPSSIEDVAEKLSSLEREIPRELGSELISFLLDESAEIRRRATSLVGKLQEKAAQAIPALLALLSKESEDSVIDEIVTTFGKMGESAEPAVLALLDLYQKSEPRSRRRARVLEALGKIGQAAKPAIPVLLSALLEEARSLSYKQLESSLHFKALSQIASWGDAQLSLSSGNDQEKILGALLCRECAQKDPNLEVFLMVREAAYSDITEVRGYAVEALGHLKDPRALPTLVQALDEEGLWGKAASALFCFQVEGLELLEAACAQKGSPKRLRDEIHRGKSNAARNPQSTPELLKRLSQDTDWSIRERVAQHPNLSEALCESLARDVDADVRAALAQNPSTPPILLATLASDYEDEVRLAVVQNINTPARVMAQLAKDSNSEVSEIASEGRYQATQE